MDAVVAVLRAKQLATISRDFRTATYEILLTDIRLPGQENKTIKKFPTTKISFEEEPAELLCTFLYNVTGGEYGGLKGKRALFVPPSRDEPVEDADAFNGALYCITVDSRDKLCPEYVDSLSSTPGFYSFNQVLDSMNSGKVAFTKLTKRLLIRLESWLREKHNVPGAIDLLFSSCAEDRLKRSVTNPAYFTDTEDSFSSGHFGENFTRSIANEALAKMMAIEKCDKTIQNPLFGSDMCYKNKIFSRSIVNESLAKMMAIERSDKIIQNPLFGSDMCYKNKVDRVVVNKYFGLGKPDYSKIVAPPDEDNTKHKAGHRFWTDEYLLHKAAFEGNAKRIQELLKEGANVNQLDNDSWPAIHYACWYGYTEAISMLLTEGSCSPNITNGNQSSPLHVAASNGRDNVAELLLKHPDIDTGAIDKNGKTALDLCSLIDKPDWQKTALIIKEAMNRPATPIHVYLMDGSHRTLKLVSGANTLVQQLHTQMLRELQLPESPGRLFTLWICSRTLQLQLKPEHKPVQHLNDWKQTIIPQMTDQDPKREDPQLFWRRDATCVQCLNEERKIKNPQAIQLLFHEAYHHYVKSLYPCAEQDILILGGILMQLNHGDFDAKRCRTILANEKSLTMLVPGSKVKAKNTNWASRITAQYKHYSQTMGNRDRSPVVLQQHFLTICWNLTVYGSAFFTGYVQIRSNRAPTLVYIGVNDVGIHIINSSNKTMLQSFSYKDIEYSVKEQQPVLEIKLNNNANRGGLSILSKQAGMVCNLMKKLDKSRALQPADRTSHSVLGH